MSRLIQLIERIGKTAPAPMGFVASARPEAAPSMVLLVSCAAPRKLQEVAGVRPDAVLLTPAKVDPKSLDKMASALGDTPWGVLLKEGSPDGVPALEENGCDFVVLATPHLSVDMLQDEELGKLLVVPGDLDKEQAHALEDLPLDAVLFSEPLSPPLSLEQLMVLAALRGEIPKPVLLSLTAPPSPWELECLRNIGVDCVVLDLDRSDAQAVETLQERIKGLPRRKARGDRVTPTVPYATVGAAHEHEEQEEEI